MLETDMIKRIVVKFEYYEVMIYLLLALKEQLSLI